MFSPSEESLDVYIPSFPGSPRSLDYASETSFVDLVTFALARDFLHEDKVLLEAAEAGDDILIDSLIRKGVNVQQVDHLGRNALHLAVISGNERAITLLLEAGIATTIKDNVGMTPLSLCLMRKYVSSLYIIEEREEYMKFIMMCTPTAEEEKIIYLLIEKGAQVNDMEAPGQRQALHFAAMSNNCELVRILFHLGANPKLLNHRNETPYEVAKIYKCKEVAALIAKLTYESGLATSGEVTANTAKPTDENKQSTDKEKTGNTTSTEFTVEPSTQNVNKMEKK
ncbi:uncharacterized protein LOC126373714 [Pectinophora gossypiella]|uniref:uncharacterized protein LOC126373714 n=1 Tax=Pectinophora gossypiella TaxID=13191 RepID=UPI00214F5F87|nr:uncharacterized protein LOC126373714 [Pectinophora gossypiella]